jgi:hypothetical protein
LAESKKQLIPGRVRYGTLQLLGKKNEADLACVNELLLAENSIKSGPIFEHVGYYTFVSRRFIENPAATWPDEVKRVAETISRGEDWADLANPELDLRARCWIAIAAGLTTYHDSEYRDLTSFVAEESRKLSRRNWADPLRRSESIKRDFESFLTAERDLFLGGSIHARLILNWWMKYSPRFVVLLAPYHFQELLPRRWPLCDRLWFGNSLGDDESLRRAIDSLYVKVAEEVFQLTTASDNRLIKHFAGELLIRAKRDPESRWNFVANPTELIDLLTLDNRPIRPTTDAEEGGPRAPNPPRSRSREKSSR